MFSAFRFEINERQEYIGRPINVAARLQGAIKNGDSNPEGKVLKSKRAFSDLYKAQTVTRNLSNVAGGESYRAIKLMLYKRPQRIDNQSSSIRS